MKNRFPLFLKITFHVFVEVFGAVLLISFLCLVMDVNRVLKLIPWIVALSSAASGYCVLDKAKTLGRHKHLLATGAGSGAALLLYGILSVLLFFSTGERPFSSWDLLIFPAIGSGCGELGGLLALKRRMSPR
ncbi:MAG: hypothetical protein JRI80_03200 [Deltaproteobacteria bacterium]|nr:hypothetical protein [Deltaproteobacteria bacterium]